MTGRTPGLMEIEGKSLSEINEEGLPVSASKTASWYGLPLPPGLHQDNRAGGYKGISGRNLDAVPLP